MSATKARRNRLSSETVEPVLTRLSPAAKRLLKEAAQASGTSLSLYLETLVQYEAKITGRLPVWSTPLNFSEAASEAA